MGRWASGSDDTIQIDRTGQIDRAGRAVPGHSRLGRLLEGRAARLAAAASLASLALAAGAVGVGSTAASAADHGHAVRGKAAASPFRVLMIGGLTGPDAADATAAEHGMEAAAAQLNAHGGIDGHHVALTVDDDQAEATLAVTELSSYLAHATPNLVWPGSTSTEGLALAPTLTRDKILANGVVSATTVVNPKINPYFFNVTGPTSLQGEAEASYLKSHGIHKVGSLYEDFIEGVELHDAELAALNAAHLDTISVSYPTDALNVTPEVQRLESDHVGEVLLDGLGEPVGLGLQARATLGWKVPVLGDALVSGTFDPAGLSAADLTGVSWIVQSADVYNPHPTAAFTTFYKAIQKYGPIKVPLFEYAAGWDVLMLSDLAATQAKSISTPAMASALEHLKKVANPPYVLASYETYTTANHALISPLEVVPMRPADKGLYNVPAGVTP